MFTINGRNRLHKWNVIVEQLTKNFWLNASELKLDLLLEEIVDFF